MNWEKAWLCAFGIWIFLIFIGSIILFVFHHCNGSCYFTNDIVRDISIPLGILFLGWTIFLIPFGIVTEYLEERRSNLKGGNIK